jgi:hypothetical protein
MLPLAELRIFLADFHRKGIDHIERCLFECDRHVLLGCYGYIVAQSGFNDQGVEGAGGAVLSAVIVSAAEMLRIPFPILAATLSEKGVSGVNFSANNCRTEV